MSIGSQLREALNTTPYRFQVRGVKFIERNKGRVLIADDMGLGKTFQAAGWAAIHPEIRPVIVVCPASLKFNWQHEFFFHANIQSHVIEGIKPYPLLQSVLIINYDILKAWLPSLLALKPALLIIDESHYVKNRAAKRTKACARLARACKHVLALSGTPITNRPVEFFPILQMLRPKEFPSFWKYASRYCNPKKSRWHRGWEFNGACNLEELHERVSSLMIRRMKTEVLKDLPPKHRTIIPVDISNWRDYTQARDEFLAWLEANGGERAVKRALGAVALVRMGKLKRIAAEGKHNHAAQWIRNFLEGTDQKLIVFGIHKTVLRKMYGVFHKKSVIVDGKNKASKARHQSVGRFQQDPKCRLFFGQLRAAGHGLTLTAASTVLFLELGWTAAEHDQAEDRPLRIGQTADCVNIYYMVGRNTIEEEIMELIEAKRDVCSRVLDGPRTFKSLLGVGNDS